MFSFQFRRKKKIIIFSWKKSFVILFFKIRNTYIIKNLEISMPILSFSFQISYQILWKNTNSYTTLVEMNFSLFSELMVKMTGEFFFTIFQVWRTLIALSLYINKVANHLHEEHFAKKVQILTHVSTYTYVMHAKKWWILFSCPKIKQNSESPKMK